MKQVKERDSLFGYDSKNHLVLSKKSLLSFAKKWEGPVYVYSKKAVIERLHLFQSMVSEALGQDPFIHYAMKANSSPVLLNLMKKNKIGIDVVSQGEMRKALTAKFAPEQILFSGVGKTETEIRFAIQKKIGQLNVESISELQRIIALSSKLKKKIRIGLRVNPEVNPLTHPYIATGFRENKFGIDFSQVEEAFRLLRAAKFTEFVGFSLHVGSQLFDFSALSEAIDKTLELERKYPCQSIDIGGGVGVRYESDAQADEKTLENFCQVLKSRLRGYRGQVRLEPGRFLVARAGVLLTQIQYIKRNSEKNFLICDSGMNHFLRPALYQAVHRIWPVQKRKESPEVFDIVGPVCESSDVLGTKRELPAPHEGDFLAVLDAGAYGYSMASDYNSFPKPKEIWF